MLPPPFRRHLHTIRSYEKLTSEGMSFLGGDLLADVAIYFDKNSMYNPFENGVEVQKLSAVDGCSHRTTTVGVARGPGKSCRNPGS